ncbi:MAG: hypothetical protein ACRDGL_10100 [Candidatus Limnocylindrales bacterium]
MKVTIALPEDTVYEQVRLRAMASHRDIRDVVEVALRAWLLSEEDAEDLAASRAALAEYAVSGGDAADAYFRRMVADQRVAYRADPEQ